MRKSNKPNNENKQRVRVLETGQLGTVTDQQLIPRKGKLHRYMQVRLDGRPHLDRWFWDDQLGGTKETCRVTFENWDGKAIMFDIEMDYDKDNLRMNVYGRPGNLKEHKGLHVQIVNNFVAGIGQHHP